MNNIEYFVSRELSIRALRLLRGGVLTWNMNYYSSTMRFIVIKIYLR